MHGEPVPSSPAESVRVLGMGNLLYGDDGVGVIAVRHLRDVFDFDPPVELIDAALLGFELLSIFDEGGPVLLIDALRTDADPGVVYCLGSTALLDEARRMRPAAHELEPIEQLRWHTALDTAPDLCLVGVAAGPSNFGIGLSLPVRSAFGSLVESVLGQLRQWGVGARPVRRATIDDTIAALIGSAPQCRAGDGS